MRYHYDNCDQPPVKHGMPAIPSNAYVVQSTQGKGRGSYYCHTHIVLAHSPEDAITRLKENAKAVIALAKARLHKDDFKPVEWIEGPSMADRREIERLRAEIAELTENLDDDPGDDTEFDRLRRESWVHTIDKNQKRIKELERGKVVCKESRFNRHMSRMLYLLAPETEHEATALDGDRAYPVSYFDDSRSISIYIGGD